MATSVVLQKVVKRYGALDEVIHGIDLKIDPGEFVVFVGPRAAASPRCCA
jgi:multiple sugar transport system ATP-binding protein